MKIAVNAWCFPDDTPVTTMLETAKAAGLDGLELNLNEPEHPGLTLDSDNHEIMTIKRLSHQYGIELHSLSTSLLWKWPLSSPDAEVRTQAKRIIRKQLELANALEIRTILVVPGIVDAYTNYEECWMRSQYELAELANHANTLGVRIGVENVWNKFLLSPVEMARYLDEISAVNLGAYFDVGNVLNFGYPEQWIKTLSHRIFKVHVKDFNTRIGNINGFVPLLSGDVNWQAVRQSLREIGYDDYLTAEIMPYQINNTQAVYDSAQQMQVIAQL